MSFVRRSEMSDNARCLGDFITQVAECRRNWSLSNGKELWFRGESRDYGANRLRPELYRPSLTHSLKPISDLQAIENQLHEEFQRMGVEFCAPISQTDWDWDSYFLMQHHSGPTRLLDWSDGALMALHFAVRNRADDSEDAYVYVLEAYRLNERIKALPDLKILKNEWRTYVSKHPSFGLDENSWEDGYLPSEDETELSLPEPPFVLDFPHLTRRISAQRSRFMVLG